MLYLFLYRRFAEPMQSLGSRCYDARFAPIQLFATFVPNQAEREVYLGHLKIGKSPE